MWTSIYIANNKKQADKLKALLDENGILTIDNKIGQNILLEALEIGKPSMFKPC